MELLLQELCQVTGLPVNSGKSTLWANDFICHRDIWFQWRAFWRLNFHYFYNKYGFDLPFKPEYMDPRRKDAYFYERVTALFFANCNDIQILSFRQGKSSEETVRGRISNYLKKHQPLFQSSVLEIGSRIHDERCTWMNNRYLCPDGDWVGIDMQPGLNVDYVMDAENLDFPDAAFNAVLCSEVLEHVWDPRKVMLEALRVLKPGGAFIVTTLFSFPVHGYPNDYWRYTPACMERLLHEAGFVDIHVETAGKIHYELNDHGEPHNSHFDEPIHIFAVARKREN